MAAQTVGTLLIDLKANTAGFKADMAAASATAKTSSREMNSAMQKDFMETKRTLALVKEDLGVGIPREMRAVIASSEMARTAILGIRDALIGLAFIDIGIEAFKKIKELFDDHGETAKQIQESAKAEKDFIEAIKLGSEAHEERLRLIGLIGKTQDEIFKSNFQHNKDLIQQQKDIIGGMIAQINAKAALLALDIKAIKDVDKAISQSGSETSAGNPQGDINRARADFNAFVETLTKPLIDAQNKLQGLEDESLRQTKQNEEDKRQERNKSADEQQKQLEQAIAKIKEFAKEEDKTLDPIEQNRLKWEEIRKEQGLIIAQHPQIVEKIALIGTIAAQWRGDQKIITEEAAKLPGELQRGLQVLKQIQELQSQSAIGGLVGSVQPSTQPKLGGSKADFMGALVDRMAGSFKDAAAQGKLLETAMLGLLTPTDKFKLLQAEIAPLMAKYKDYPDVIKALTREVQLANPEFEKLKAASTQFGQDLANELDTLILKGGTFHDFLQNIIKDLAEIILKAALLGPLEKAFSGGDSGVGGILGSLGKLFGFASGGRPPTGQLSIVGENGPELFMPDSAGTIIPNGAGFGGGVNNYYSIDARGADAGVEMRIRRALAATQQQSVKQAVMANREYSLRK